MNNYCYQCHLMKCYCRCPPSFSPEIIYGPQGAQGNRGNQGPQGAQGPDGFTGFTGSIGNIGPLGSQGAQGPTGQTGDRGPTGFTGPVGVYILDNGTFYGDYIFWNNNVSPAKWDVGSSKINLGQNAGKFNQGTNGFALGKESGNTNQKTNALAIGYRAGFTGQGQNTVAIGNNAGETNQGNNSIAIGNGAGVNDQSQNSIILNGRGGVLDASESGFYVAHVRDVSEINLLLYYRIDLNEILYTNVGLHGSLIIDTTRNYSIPSYVKVAYISGVGAGGAGGDFQVLGGYYLGGGGGGSGGAIYRYPINIYDPSFNIVIGNGGQPTQRNGGTTIIEYYISNTQKASIYLGGGGRGKPPTDIFGNDSYGGAGGSVSFSSLNNVNADQTTSPPVNTVSPFLSASQSGATQKGKSGRTILPIILGSSGGDGPIQFGTSFSGGDCNGFYRGGLGELYGGGGGAASIFANGGNGGLTLPRNGIYGSGGGGGGGGDRTNPVYNSAPGGNGRVVIEW
jgi:integrin beta 8/collagen type VII alpha